MKKIFQCGFFIILFLFFVLTSVFADSDRSMDLERIVITKSKSFLLNSYQIDNQDLEYSPKESIIENLSYAPIDLQSRSPQAGIQSDFSLRGSNFQGVLFLLNGQKINDPQTGHHNQDIPLTKEDVENIKVIPGASSSLFGSDAIGGAVNIVLKKPDKNRIVTELSGGSFNSARGLFSITEKTDNFGVRFSAQKEESSGFRYDTDFKKLIANMASTFDIPGGDANLSFGYEDQSFGAFDFYTPGSNFPSKEWTETRLLNTGVNWEYEGFFVKPNFLWRRHYDKFMLDKTQIRSRYLNHHRTDVLTPNIYFQKDTGFLGVLGTGIEYGQEKINSTNLGKHIRNHKSAFFDDNKELGSGFSYAGSFRYDDYDGFDKEYTGSINLKQELTDKDSINLGISKNIRVPSFTELYYVDPTTLGNSGLAAEKAMNYQFGYERKLEKLSWGNSIFYREESNMIDWVKRNPSEAQFKAENIAQDYVYGVESFIKFNLNEKTTLNWNYTYLDKHIYDQGLIYKYGQNYINHLTSGVLTFNSPIGPQTVGLTYKKKPNRRGWLLLDSHLSCNFIKHSQLFFNVTNLFNVEYQEIDGIPQPGRWMEGGVRFSW